MMTNSAANLSEMGSMGVDVARGFPGNLSEGTVAPDTAGINIGFIIIQLHTPAVAGCTVKSLGFMESGKIHVA
jgi:hypothetical protein